MKNNLKLTVRAGTDRFLMEFAVNCDFLTLSSRFLCPSSGKRYFALYNTSTFQYTSGCKHFAFTLWPWMPLCLNTTQVAACIKFTLSDSKGQTNSPPLHFGRATVNTRWQRGRQPFPSGALWFCKTLQQRGFDFTSLKMQKGQRLAVAGLEQEGRVDSTFIPLI